MPDLDERFSALVEVKPVFLVTAVRPTLAASAVAATPPQPRENRTMRMEYKMYSKSLKSLVPGAGLEPARAFRPIGF